MEIADGPAGAVRIEDDAHELHAGIEVDGCREVLIRIPRARIGHAKRAGLVLPVELYVECAAGTERGDAGGVGVRARARDVDGVAKPFSRLRPPDRRSTLGCRGDVDVGRPIRTASVAESQVVVRDALSAVVEVLGFDRSRNDGWRSTARCLRGCRSGERSGECDC